MSGGTPCCVPGCRHNSKYHRTVSFHAFPKNLALRKIWVKLVNRQAPSGRFTLWQPKHFHRICGAHFNVSGKKAKTDRIPTIFNKSKTTNKKRVERRRVRRVDDEPFCETASEAINEILLEGVDGGMDPDSTLPLENVNVATGSSSSSSFIQDLDRNVDPSGHWDHDHTYCLQDEPSIVINALKIALDKARDDLHNCEVETMNAKNEVASLQMQLDACKLEKLAEKEESGRLKLQLSNLNIECDRLKKRIGKGPSHYSFYKSCMKDEGKLKFYTGFSNKNSFDDFVQLIHPGYMLARQMDTSGRVVRVLNFNYQLLLVLMKLRLGLLEKDLAYRFGVSQSTVSLIWQFWLDFLSTHLCQIPIWPSKNLVVKHMPNGFKQKFPSTRVIIDCTEIFIEKPSSYNVQSDTYSSYKHHNTAKGLIGISPNGHISFVSDLYPGRISDKDIVSDSGFIELLEPGDDVMADRGFLIEDLLKVKGATLNMPPFLEKGKQQFSIEDDMKTKQIASLRVHIERVIHVVKVFRILKYVFPNSMASHLNSVWKVCCYLVNFIDEPLLDRNEDIS